MLFANKLERYLHSVDLDIEAAQELCDEIHYRETTGYELTLYEEDLWYALTERIQRGR